MCSFGISTFAPNTKLVIDEIADPEIREVFIKWGYELSKQHIQRIHDNKDYEEYERIIAPKLWKKCMKQEEEIESLKKKINFLMGTRQVKNSERFSLISC